MRFDIIMWAKNGGSTLPSVLSHAEKFLPNEFVHRRIFVDDHSIDGSRDIAERFHWEIHANEGGGVAAGVNKALCLADCDYFMSIEQDVLISNRWWASVAPHMEKPNVAVAQGWRLPEETQHVVRKFEEYRLERYKKYDLPIFSIDNTLFKSSVVKSIAPVPSELRYSGVDTYIYRNVLSRGYRWVTDYDVVSTHLRQGGIREQINRYYRYGIDTPTLDRYELSSDSRYIRRGMRSALAILFFSPIRGLLIGVTKRCPQITVYYPLIRLALLSGYLKSTRYKLRS